MIRVFLYDANGEDREIPLETDELPKLDDQKLLWIEVEGRDEDDLKKLGSLLGLEPDIVKELCDKKRGPRRSITMVRTSTATCWR